ncbi:hypothetical protein [Rhodococcus tibetensis]|uniref:Uncharacterized protein n=1 Tax=Rhodococcus tibetensis TaxID=2965064 RepID=A0ABT1Q7Y2_9NOCA|nr:hypothetical protein [Rhodococcus sp. FXJ9.536]MCQ4118355.1 hypothetical protein [Rhodococcus sp. FXJ9.536]
MSEHLATPRTRDRRPAADAFAQLMDAQRSGSDAWPRPRAVSHPGANLIAITGLGGIDSLSGTAAFNGVEIQIQALDSPTPA